MKLLIQNSFGAGIFETEFTGIRLHPSLPKIWE